jgi:hypothetical protein
VCGAAAPQGGEADVEEAGSNDLSESEMGDGGPPGGHAAVSCALSLVTSDGSRLRTPHKITIRCSSYSRLPRLFVPGRAHTWSMAAQTLE